MISASGQISPRGDEGLAVARQKTQLEQDGVQVDTMAGGGERVDLKRYGWFPSEVVIP